MAKRGSSRGGRRSSSRQTSSKATAAKPAEVEVVEESGGMGLDAGIAILTTMVLLVAFLFVDALRGAYGEGMFF